MRLPSSTPFNGHYGSIVWPASSGGRGALFGARCGRRGWPTRAGGQARRDDEAQCAARRNRRPAEWDSQERQGTVWYFGENTAELDKSGHVTNAEGTWRAGVDGARAGIFMFARPRVGRSAQQEFYKGQAEDHFRVLSLHASVDVP